MICVVWGEEATSVILLSDFNDNFNIVLLTIVLLYY